MWNTCEYHQTLGDFDRTDARNAPDVVAAEIDEHEVLGAFLFVREQLRGETLIIRGSRSARARSGDGAKRHAAVGDAYQQFGR